MIEVKEECVRCNKWRFIDIDNRHCKSCWIKAPEGRRLKELVRNVKASINDDHLNKLKYSLGPNTIKDAIAITEKKIRPLGLNVLADLIEDKADKDKAVGNLLKMYRNSNPRLESLIVIQALNEIVNDTIDGLPWEECDD